MQLQNVTEILIRWTEKARAAIGKARGENNSQTH
jgi:hypothetical protein